MYRLFYSIKYSQSRDTTKEGKEAIIMKDAFLKSADLVLKELNSDGKHGMSLAQVEESREKYGKNSFTQQARESMTKRIWDASTEPMLLMLIFAAITHWRSILPDILQEGNTTSWNVPGFLRQSFFRS